MAKEYTKREIEDIVKAQFKNKDFKDAVKRELNGRDFDKAIEDAITEKMLEDKVVQIVRNAMVQYAKTMWIKRDFWTNNIKNLGT